MIPAASEVAGSCKEDFCRESYLGMMTVIDWFVQY